MDPQLIAYLDRRFDETNRSFTEVLDQRIRGVHVQMEAMDSKIDEQIRGVRVLIESMDSKIDLVGEGVANNAQAVRALRSDMERQFDEVKAVNRISYMEIERRLRDHDRRLADLEAR